MTAAAHDEAGFLALARELSARTGTALDAYKPKCLRRRIAVRMRARGVHTYEAYRDVIAADAAELARLQDALTINVTRFFRNPEAWEAVARLVPPLVARGRPVRGWSAGCASGEEAYTLAMLWAQHAPGPDALARLRVDATDIDRQSLDRARAARYREEAFVEAPPPAVEAFTRAVPGGGREVVPALRALVDVRPLDLTHGALPTGAYDLVLCRNVVIYFDRALQERLFAAFFDALVPGGHLVLGKVETLLGPARDRFEAVDVRERIYRRPA